MTTKRKNRIAWGLALLLAGLVLGGSWVGIRRTYGFGGWIGLRGSRIRNVHGAWEFGAGEGPVKGLYVVRLGPVLVAWWRR
jgi:hypothetical protein